MAVNTKKISSLSEKTSLDGDEYLMVVKNNRSYKAKSSLFTSDKIEEIKQTINKGDGANNPIIVKTSSGDIATFNVKNGTKGSDGATGKKGEKGETGNSGIAIYNENPDYLIVDSVDGTTIVDGVVTILNDKELAESILSARQGTIINNKLDKLKEWYGTQDDYDELVATNKINDDTKYFIVGEE
jgi:hypothetical protein